MLFCTRDSNDPGCPMAHRTNALSEFATVLFPEEFSSHHFGGAD
jgi:hypothetical protein